MPGFYQKPRSLDGDIDFVAARMLDQFRITRTSFPPRHSQRSNLLASAVLIG